MTATVVDYVADGYDGFPVSGDNAITFPGSGGRDTLPAGQLWEREAEREPEPTGRLTRVLRHARLERKRGNR